MSEHPSKVISESKTIEVPEFQMMQFTPICVISFSGNRMLSNTSLMHSENAPDQEIIEHNIKTLHEKGIIGPFDRHLVIRGQRITIVGKELNGFGECDGQYDPIDPVHIKPLTMTNVMKPDDKSL